MDSGSRMLMLAAALTVIGLAVSLVLVGITNDGGLDSMRTDHDAADVTVDLSEGGTTMSVGDEATVAFAVTPYPLTDEGLTLTYVVADADLGDNRHVSEISAVFDFGQDGPRIMDFEPDSGEYQSEGIDVDVNNASDIGMNLYDVTITFDGQPLSGVAGPVGAISFDGSGIRGGTVTGTISITVTDNGLLPESDRYVYDVTFVL